MLQIRDDKSNLLEVFPVGYIWISVNNVNPSEFLGGTWEQLKDVFLLAAGDKHSGGSTGGDEEVTLTTSNLPSHTHGTVSASTGNGSTESTNLGTEYVYFYQPSSGNNWSGNCNSGTNPNDKNAYVGFLDITDKGGSYVRLNSDEYWAYVSLGSHSHSIKPTGGGIAHSNMPPYLTVYMFVRVA